MQAKTLLSKVTAGVTALLITVFCLIGPSAKAQYITIDSALARYLSNNGYSHCISGSTLDTTCADTSSNKSLWIWGNKNIKDIAGIKYFKHLTSLWVYGMTIDSLPQMPPQLVSLAVGNTRDSNKHKLAPLPATLQSFSLYCSYSSGVDSTNYFDSLPTLPNSLKALSIYSARIKNYPARLPDSLDNLYIANCNLDSLPSLPQKLISLYLYNDTIRALPALGDSLQSLYLFNLKKLTAIPTLPAHLLYLDVWGDTLITSLPALPSSLLYLYGYNQHFTSFPSTLPSGLKWMICSNCNLDTLPALPSSLTYLWVTNNNLKSLPALPNGIFDLGTAFNPLKSLPSPLPDSLWYLYCSYDSLTTLPALPARLIYLVCDNNKIDTMPTLPSHIGYLNCSNNKLSYLPTLPSSMYDLICRNNSLTSLPALHANLWYLDAAYNTPLTGVPDLPKTLWYLNLSHNKNVTCLPTLNSGMYLYFDSTGVSCVPNYAPSYSYPAIGTYPLCAPGGSCEVGWNITGHVYKDSITACTFDTLDPVYSYIRVLLYAKDTLSQISYTTVNGGFTFRTAGYDTFVASVDTVHLAYRVKCPATDTIVKIVTATDSLKQHADFALECKSGYDGAIWNIYSWNWYFQPGHVSEVAIYGGDISKLYGLRCLSGVSGKVVAYIHGPVTYDSFPSYSLRPTSANNDSIVWTVSDFGAVNPFYAFHFKLHTDTAATWGDTVGITARITLNTIDADSTNNTLRQRFWVFSSWDPNEKEVYPTTPHSTNDWITYTVHFQNSGKAAAENIHINDTLDPHLDLNTFEIVASDHPVHAHMMPGGIVQFYFNNINLADSSSDPKHSTGYVKYRLKMKSNTPFGTAIKNTAYVYFDYNKPVATNTAVSTLTHAYSSTGVKPGVTSAAAIQVYPNPAKDLITIKLSGNNYITGMQLHDVMGRLLATYNNKTNTNVFRLNMSNYPAGVYFVKVQDNAGNAMTKKVVLSK